MDFELNSILIALKCLSYQILAQKEVSIDDHCLMPQLHDTLSNEGAVLLVDCLNDIDSRLANAQQQNSEHITYGTQWTFRGLTID